MKGQVDVELFRWRFYPPVIPFAPAFRHMCIGTEAQHIFSMAALPWFFTFGPTYVHYSVIALQCLFHSNSQLTSGTQKMGLGHPSVGLGTFTKMHKTHTLSPHTETCSYIMLSPITSGKTDLVYCCCGRRKKYIQDRIITAQHPVNVPKGDTPI